MNQDPIKATPSFKINPIIKQLEVELIDLRTSISKISVESQTLEDDVRSIQSKIVSMMDGIKQYIFAVEKQALQFEEGKEDSPILDIFSEKKGERLKINLYLWQVFNFICIHTQYFPQQLGQIIAPLLQFEVQTQNLHSANSFKNALIFVHNLVAKEIKRQDFSIELHRILNIILRHQFEKQKSAKKKIVSIIPNLKNEDHYVAQMEWVSYIFTKLFNKQTSRNRKQSILKYFSSKSSQKKILFYLLHTISNYMQNMIDNRVTTEMIEGYDSHLNDIKDMYSNSDKNITSVCVSLQDLEFVIACFKDHLREYQKIVQEYLKEKLKKQTEEEIMKNIEKKWIQNADILTEIGYFLNVILFLGGYNNKLQNFVTEHLLEKDSFLFQHLELSYLLYRNIQSTRYQTKVQMLVQMEKQAKKKLFDLVSLELQGNKDVNIKDLGLQKILAPGQLVQQLRLLTNLVHINHRAQIPFENQPKYIHIILGLTHESASQATMSEWAIMFIKNVSEMSQKLREEIGKVKMEVKVE